MKLVDYINNFIYIIFMGKSVPFQNNKIIHYLFYNL